MVVELTGLNKEEEFPSVARSWVCMSGIEQRSI